eukprot:g15868.t1
MSKMHRATMLLAAPVGLAARLMKTTSRSQLQKTESFLKKGKHRNLMGKQRNNKPTSSLLENSSKTHGFGTARCCAYPPFASEQERGDVVAPAGGGAQGSSSSGSGSTSGASGGDEANAPSTPTASTTPFKDDAPSWFYQSDWACAPSDRGSIRKCRPDSNWPDDGCDPKTHFKQYCSDEDKIPCSEMGSKTMEGSKKDGKYSEGGMGFMCPHLALGSAELVQAVKADGKDPDKVAYGVVTFDKLACGQCVELVDLDPDKLKYAPKLIAQIFNSDSVAVDVYVAGGGLGAFNGCSKKNKWVPTKNAGYFYKDYLKGRLKNFLKSQPDAEKISRDFTALDIDMALKGNGGLRGGRSWAECMKPCTEGAEKCTEKCKAKVSPKNGDGGPRNGCGSDKELCITDKEACKYAFTGWSDYTTQKAIESCEWAFDHDMHFNRNVKLTVVPCPKSLVKLTGLRPVDLAQGPIAGKGQPINWHTNTYTTTMEDCSEPTCSRLSNTIDGKWEKGYETLYTCNAVGEKMVEGMPPKNPCGR